LKIIDDEVNRNGSNIFQAFKNFDPNGDNHVDERDFSDAITRNAFV
jgi:hypothetical protein